MTNHERGGVEVVCQEASGHYFCIAKAQSASPHTKATMVFIHGAGGGAWYWENMMEYFAERGHTCYAPDLIGHGRSHESIRTASIGEYVADVRHFLDHVVLPHGGELPILVGHSMGGLIAQKVAEGGTISCAIFVTPAPPSGITYRHGDSVKVAAEDIIFGSWSLLVTGKSFSPTRALVESAFADPKASALAIEAIFLHRIVESPYALKEIYFSEVAVCRENIGCPMLVVSAGKDQIIRPDVASEIARHYDAGLITIPHLGHMCVLETGWEEVARSVEHWLSLPITS